MYMTLDGFAEFPKYPGSDAASDETDPIFADMWVNRSDSADTVVFGRRAYEEHVNFHSLAARKPSDPKFLFDFSRWLEATQMVVLAHNLARAEWQRPRILKGDLEQVIAYLRGGPGRDIVVDGGPSVVQECLWRGLADDYLMAVWPVVLGRGKTYWGSMVMQQTLKLLSVKHTQYGELLLHCEALRSEDAATS